MPEDRLNLPFTGLVSFMRVPTCTDLDAVDAEERMGVERRRQGVGAARVGQSRLVEGHGEEDETGGAAAHELAQELQRLIRMFDITGLDVVAELAGQTRGQVTDRASAC